MHEVITYSGGPNLGVELDEELMDDNLPFQIYVDAHRAALALVNNGLPEECLGDVKLHLSADRPAIQVGKVILGRVCGRFHYSSSKGIISIFTNNLWEMYKGKKVITDVNDTFLHEGKHAIDIYDAPKKMKAMNDIVENVRKVGVPCGLAMAGSGDLLFGLGLTYLGFMSYYLDPSEIEARLFARRMNKKEEYQHIVNITPNRWR